MTSHFIYSLKVGLLRCGMFKRVSQFSLIFKNYPFDSIVDEAVLTSCLPLSVGKYDERAVLGNHGVSYLLLPSGLADMTVALTQ